MSELTNLAKLIDKTGIVTAATNPLNGRIELIWANGAQLPVGTTFIERFGALIQSPKQVKIHVYGNSILTGFPDPIMAAQQVSVGKLVVVKNSAVAGYTSASVLAKLLTDGVDSDADVVAFMEGTNDAAQAVSYATHVANFKAIIAEIARVGKIPMLLITPPNDAAYAATANGNALRDVLLAQRLKIPSFDAWGRYRDADGTWTAGVSSDLIHPNSATTSQAGADLYALIRDGSTPLFLPMANTGDGLFGSNILQLTDTNADGLPDGWANLSLTTPTFALSDFSYPYRGKKCAVTFSQSVNGKMYREITPGFVVGDRIKLSGICGLSATTNAKLSLFLRFSGGGIDVYAISTTLANGAQYFSTEYIVPAGTTKLQVYIDFSTATTGAFSGVAEFGCIDIYNMTTLTALVA